MQKGATTTNSKKNNNNNNKLKENWNDCRNDTMEKLVKKGKLCVWGWDIECIDYQHTFTASKRL